MTQWLWGLCCALIRACEERRRFRSAPDIWRSWYGGGRYVHVADKLFVCASVRVSRCKNVFPYAFCVCSTEMREHFVVVFADRKWDILAHVHIWLQSESSVLLPQRIFAHISFPFSLCVGIGNVCFYFICLISSFTSSLHAHAHAPPHPWLAVRQRGNRAYSPLSASRLIQPPCQSRTRLPEELGEPCLPLISQQIRGKWKQMK